MKKNLNLKSFVAIFAASTLFACTQDGIDNLPVQTEEENEAMNELPKRRTYEEALAVAQDAIGLLGENCTTRSGKPRSINTADVQYIVNTSSTRSTEEPDTMMYVFNYEDNAGFAVVSANRATEELIAVTEQGNYVAGEETGNGGFDLYMDMAEQYVTMAAEPLPGVGGDDDGMEEFTEFRMFVDRDTITYGPYIPVRWGQDWPYNKACPIQNGKRTKAGCVATAIAQIMTYYKHPTSMTIYDTYSVYEQDLDWTNINKHVYTESTTSTACSQCTVSGWHNVIGALVAQIGREVNMWYTDSVSSAFSENVASALTSFGYTCDPFRNYANTTVTSSIKSGKPVYMCGAVAGANIGHAWIVDGYRHVHALHRECIRPMSQLFWTELRRWTTDDYYYHINWGWNGDSNGYFLIDEFDTDRSFDLDTEEYEESFDFTVQLMMYANIRKR